MTKISQIKHSSLLAKYQRIQEEMQPNLPDSHPSVMLKDQDSQIVSVVHYELPRTKSHCESVRTKTENKFSILSVGFT